VNVFVERSMTACASGDYAQFTSLWTSRQEAVTVREFDRGWRAIRVLRVEVERLQPFRTEIDGPLSYYLRASAEFDPSVPKPERTVELIVQQEDGQWKLARAPKELRERIDEADRLAEDSTATMAPPAESVKP
jgi:hypothetical protein